MQLEVLLSSRGKGLVEYVRRNRSVLNRDAVYHTIILQGGSLNEHHVCQGNASHVRLYRQDGYGLAKSRNLAMTLAHGDVCLFTDDDVEFLPDFEKKVCEAFEQHTDADIITFQALDAQLKKYRPYEKYGKWHSVRSVFGVSSIEIAFRKDRIQRKGLKFDENFGLGTEFPSAEENIFLIDALYAGCKIAYWPEPIVIHHGKSYGESLLEEVVMRGKGALFSRFYGRRAFLPIIAFGFKKYPIYRRSMTLWAALKSLRAGQRLYQNHIISPSK